MTTAYPSLEQFKVLPARDGLVHFVFDMPDRSMNVFSNKAIHELGQFAAWLKQSDVRGVVVRSGKISAFCAGADLGELGVAYDMIVAARPQDRFDIAFNHFFPLSQAIRCLETAGKPVAAAIAGLALGGGCELALGAHYRVLVDAPNAAMGLPESLVGLLPGAGGTQRMPRLVGVDRALPILLEGARLSGQAALDAGLVHQLAAPGQEVELAEEWALRAGDARQPWDAPDYAPLTHADVAPALNEARAAALRQTRGHYPAPLAILDCVEQGIVQSFDAAIRTEMSIFSHLIMRAEPRNMIQSLFLGKTDYERAAKKGEIPEAVGEAVQALAVVLPKPGDLSPALAAAGFGGGEGAPVQTRVGSTYWIDRTDNALAADARAAVETMVRAAAPFAQRLNAKDRRMADYALIRDHGFPAYLGGPISMAALGR